MPPDAPPPGSPADWLRYAHSDLNLASITPPSEVLLESLCFHAQQAAEKAIKAVLIHLEIPAPKSHSIRMLLDLLSDTLLVPEVVEDATILTDYAVMSRYPGDVEPVEEEEYKTALRLARTVIAWATEVTSNKT